MWGEKNHEKIDSASENQTGISDFGCVTCLMLKANTEPVFCGNKPKPPNKQGCCKQVAATAQEEPSKAAAFAKAQLRLVFHTLPALKNEKQRSLTMSYGLKKNWEGKLVNRDQTYAGLLRKGAWCSFPVVVGSSGVCPWVQWAMGSQLRCFLHQRSSPGPMQCRKLSFSPQFLVFEVLICQAHAFGQEESTALWEQRGMLSPAGRTREGAVGHFPMLFRCPRWMREEKKTWRCQKCQHWRKESTKKKAHMHLQLI